MILRSKDVETEAFLSADLGNLLDIRRSRRRYDGFAFKIVDRLEISRLFGHEAVGGNEMRNGEGDLLLPIEIVCGGAALEIDGAVRDQRNTGGRGDWIELHLQLVELELGFDRIHDAIAEIHGIAHDLLLIVIVGEWHRGFAVTQGDGAGLLDLLERACEILRKCGVRAETRDGQHRQQFRQMHCDSSLPDM